MVRFVREYVISEEEAQDVVQDMFLHLWERRDILDSVSNLNAFLFTLIKNRCIDYYRQTTTRLNAKKESLDNIHEQELHLKMEALGQFDTNMFDENEMEELLEKAIEKLPDKCRQIFILSRMDGLRHEEIAQKLDISVHTVQNHIVSALRRLRMELKDYLPLFVFMI
jgi:RNA polymerase sigma-70 factor (ECF subfamily)